VITARTIRIVDRYSLVAPFGVRFWDAAADTPVRAPLSVVVSPVNDPRVRIQASVNRSGVYVIHRFPGLTRAVAGGGDEVYWSQPLPQRSVRVEVVDPEGQYHPVSFPAQIPFRGLFTLSCAPLSPPESTSAIALYPTPTYPIAAGRAVIRTELKHASSDAPVAWAMLTAEHRGTALAHGIADAQGRAALIFPYPEPVRRRITSPPSSPPAPAAGPITWDIELSVFHSSALSLSRIPDYCALLQQPQARLLDSLSPPADFPGVSIVLGHETVVASAGKSCLYIAPI
jgi:hypothetical protein